MKHHKPITAGGKRKPQPDLKQDGVKTGFGSGKAKKEPSLTQWLIVGGILLITFLIFKPAINYDYVNWDDDVNVTQNPNVQHLDAASVRDMFTGTVIGGYTPLTTLSFALDKQYIGDSPSAHHLINILLHLLCTALVFFFIRSLGMDLFVSGLVALLFGITPMRVESVAWITERKDVLYSVFYFAALLLYVSYVKSRKLVFYFLALIAFILSLFSKIQAVALPLSIVLIDYYFDRRFIAKQLLNKIPFFILSLAFGLAGMLLLNKAGSLETGTILPLYQRIFIGSYSLLVYIIKGIVPYELSAIYPFPSQLSFVHYASMAVVLILGYLIWKIKRYRAEIVFGSLFFFFNVVFMLQVVGAGQGFIADRFTYVAYTGLFFLVAFFSGLLMKQENRRFIMVVVLSVYLILTGIVTANRLRVWKNSETLFSDVIRKYPKVAVAHNNIGRYYREKMDYNKAIESYTRALELNPKGYSTFSNRGKAYFDLGKIDEALSDFDKSLAVNPGYVEALSNRGAALAMKGNLEQALTDLNKAIKIDPANINAISNRALTYYTLKQSDSAIADITNYLRLKPGDADMINLRGLCYGNLKNYKEALSDFDLSIRLSPNQGAFYQNRSSLFNEMGDKPKALEDILRAQELGVKVNPEYIKYLQQK